jgi:predicted DsbA family dithiol-disulfide isomerase
MKTKELSKLLSEKGLTSEQVVKIIESYEKNRERVKKYQKKTYEKVSVSVRKEVINEISQLTGIDAKKVKKYLAATKLVKEVSKEEREIIKEALRQIEGK